MSAVKDGVKRRTWSLEDRQRIVGEALAPDASVAAVARRHGLNANLIFKWLRRSREGWLDRRRAPAKETAAARMSPELAAQTFVPVELLELKPAPMSPALPPSSAPVAKMTDAAVGECGGSKEGLWADGRKGRDRENQFAPKRLECA